MQLEAWQSVNFWRSPSEGRGQKQDLSEAPQTLLPRYPTPCQLAQGLLLGSDSWEVWVRGCCKENVSSLPRLMCMFKLASLNAIPNSYFKFETTEDLAAGGGVKGEEGDLKRQNIWGCFLKSSMKERMSDGKCMSQARLQSRCSRITETPYFAPACFGQPRGVCRK